MVLHGNNSTISEDEAALYDRQIRLWGLDAQKRLRASNVLVIGACGLGAEVIKNLVLAGVNSLKIVDHRSVTEADSYSNFFVPHDSEEKNVALASLERVQNLNPMVNVTAEALEISQICDNYLSQFSVVCVCGGSKEEISNLNNKCREFGILFFAGEVYGMHGYFFEDLIDHSYVEEVKAKVETGKSDEKESSEETKMVKRQESFIPFSTAIDIDWTSQKYGTRLKRTTPSLFILNVLHEFSFLHKRRPDPSRREEDEIELLTIKNSLLDKLSVPQGKLSNDFVKSIFGQVSPICAVVGGVLGQEIIKAVSGKDAPLNNFFFFSPDDGAGVVENFGY
ncbi:SUMO-activating enzyme subunit 1 [Armadillidium nasatum]|uniref:SUMO-activating enzyme subunit 1 n=1 Tax=Armadillidium nasatum TaxID=96803 RepID=A0A5N5SNH2_9CRUS|nr:SUMO-activating enzyme subunit 1 [Armadillidium nasatum]